MERSELFNVKFITVGVEFPRTPKVFVALTMIDVPANAGDATIRIDIEAININEKGFQIKVKTWHNSTIYGLHVGWLAYLD